MNALQFDAPPDARMMPVPDSPTNPAPAPARQNALSPVPMMAQPRPKQQQPNMLAQAFKSFARGFAPEQVKASDERTKAEAGERTKKALVWMQQTAAQPVERRAQFTQQYAQQIAADTGQPVEVIMQSAQDPNGFTDEAISQGVAALSAQLGQGPAAPDYQFLQGPDGAISLGDKGTGQVRQVQPGTPKPPSPAKYNYQDMVGPQGPGIYAVNEADPTDARFVGKQIPKQGDGPAPPSGYRWNDRGGLEAIPGGPADKAPGAGMDPEFIKLERAYADDWDKIYGDYSQVNQQYNRAKNLGALAAKDPKSRSAADLALIVTLTKMLDPTSVAREGEVKLTQSSASLVDQAANLMNQWQNGQTILPDKQRQALLNLADTLMPSYTEAYQKRAKDAYSAAKEYGFSPNRVMQGFDVSSFERNEGVKSAEGNPWPTIRAQSGLPDNYSDFDPETAGMIDAAFADGGAGSYQPGAIDVDEDTGQRYRFKGGDATNPNSWELVR